jgi:hypothetical protein
VAELAKAVVERKQVPDIIGLLYFLLKCKRPLESIYKLINIKILLLEVHHEFMTLQHRIYCWLQVCAL